MPEQIQHPPQTGRNRSIQSVIRDYLMLCRYPHAPERQAKLIHVRQRMPTTPNFRQVGKIIIQAGIAGTSNVSQGEKAATRLWVTKIKSAIDDCQLRGVQICLQFRRCHQRRPIRHSTASSSG
jgi:hypothetical protein